MHLSLWIFPRSNRLPGLITWTPFYLSLILLLQTLTLPASVLANTYGDGCAKNTDCTDTYFCSTETRRCDCVKHVTRKWVSIYDFDTKQCLSIVDKICGRRETSGALLPQCVPNASCEVATDEDLQNLGSSSLPEILGVCKCDTGFEKNDKSLCSLRPPQPLIPTSGGTRDLGIFGGMVGQGGSDDLPSAAPSTKDEKDPNHSIDVDTNALIDVDTKLITFVNVKNGVSMTLISEKVLVAAFAVILVYFK